MADDNGRLQSQLLSVSNCERVSQGVGDIIFTHGLATTESTVDGNKSCDTPDAIYFYNHTFLSTVAPAVFAADRQ